MTESIEEFMNLFYASPTVREVNRNAAKVRPATTAPVAAEKSATLNPLDYVPGMSKAARLIAAKKEQANNMDFANMTPEQIAAVAEALGVPIEGGQTSVVQDIMSGIGSLFGTPTASGAKKAASSSASASSTNKSSGIDMAKWAERFVDPKTGQTAEWATIGPSGSDEEEWEDLGFRSKSEWSMAIREYMQSQGINATASNYRRYASQFRQYYLSNLPKTPYTGSSVGRSGGKTPTKPTTPNPTTPIPPQVQTLDIPFVKNQSLWIQELVKNMFAANIGALPTKPASSTK